MLDALRPYGPDAEDCWIGDDVATGCRIMRHAPDHADDCQVATGGGGRFHLVADARLDAREDLASALARPLHAPGLSDAKLIMLAFERWGEKCFERLYGDYAFAIWDSLHRRWLLGRDALGGRPLCYFLSPNLFAFASMPRGVHALPEVPYEPDTNLLTLALDLVVPSPHATCFRGIMRVGSGEFVIVGRDGEHRHRHWNPDPSPLRLRRSRDYADALRAEVDRAVRARLPPAGNVAAHLSAGLDSSAVATTAARELARRGDDLIAFTAVPRTRCEADPPGRVTDEGPLAALTAASYPNIEHVRVQGGYGSPLDAFGWAFDLCEQPLLNLCNQPWREAIYEQTHARGLTVLLTGQLGNLTLSYRINRTRRERFRLRGLAALWDELGELRWWAGGGSKAILETLAARRQGQVRQLAPSLINPVWRSRHGEQSDTLHNWRAPDTHAERLAALRRVELADYAKGTLARWRIDERDPTSDRRLVEFCLSVPDTQFTLGGVPASLARRALSDRVPRAVLRSRARGLQAADWHAGFVDPHAELTAAIQGLAECAETAEMLDLPRMRNLVENWPSGRWQSPEIVTNYRLHLLRALSNGDFLRRATLARARAAVPS